MEEGCCVGGGGGGDGRDDDENGKWGLGVLGDDARAAGVSRSRCCRVAVVDREREGCVESGLSPEMRVWVWGFR
jgi:hypothetical protein